jgi:uncharacterized protein (TIGR03000 family)
MFLSRIGLGVAVLLLASGTGAAGPGGGGGGHGGGGGRGGAHAGGGAPRAGAYGSGYYGGGYYPFGGFYGPYAGFGYPYYADAYGMGSSWYGLSEPYNYGPSVGSYQSRLWSELAYPAKGGMPTFVPANPSTLPPGTVPQPFNAQPSPPVMPAPATLEAIVPNGGQVWFDNKLTQVSGTHWNYNSPELAPGNTVTVSVRAKWSNAGSERLYDLPLVLKAGDKMTVDLSRPGQ